MKSLLLIFYLLSISLYSLCALTFQYSISYPDGIFSGFKYETGIFQSQMQLNYNEGALQLNRFTFISEHLSMGSVSFNGLLKDLNNEDLHYYSYDETSKIIINKDGKPRNNIGIIFEIEEIDTGCSVYRNDKMSQLIFWKNFCLSELLLVSLSQSLTLKEGSASNEAWYLDEALLYSDYFVNNQFSIVLGSVENFGGCEIQTNGSQWDSPGFSILLLGGYAFNGIYVQNELRYNSPGYISSDLKPGKYSWLFKGKIDFLNLPVSLRNSYYFSLQQEKLPWMNRLWQFNFETDLKYEWNSWCFEASLDSLFYNREEAPFALSLFFGGSVKKQYESFYWQLSGKAGFDLIYIYTLKVKGGYENAFLDVNFSSSVEIDRRITMDLSLKGKLLVGDYRLLAELSFEDLGIYNSFPIKMKPYFFIGLEL